MESYLNDNRSWAEITNPSGNISNLTLQSGVAYSYSDISDKHYYVSSLLSDKHITSAICDQTSFNPYDIVDIEIIVPNKVVRVTFADGTQYKSICSDEDVFSLEQAITICIAKHTYGSSSKYNNAVDKTIKIYNKKIKDEEKRKREEERIKAKRLKNKKRIEEKRKKKADEEKAYREAIIKLAKIK